MNGAWAHWDAETIAGHADELAVLTEHAEAVTMAEPCVSHGAPAVVALAGRRLVVAWTGVLPEWGTGRLEVRVDGPSATLRQGKLDAAFVAVPFAQAADLIVNQQDKGGADALDK